MRVFAFALLLVVSALSSAQLPTWDGVVSAAQSTWKKTVDAGRPLAERIAREAPERFRAARKQADLLLKQADRYAKSGDLQQKRDLAAELWRVRGSLDLMALLDPTTLKMFGIELPDLNRLRASVARQINLLTR